MFFYLFSFGCRKNGAAEADEVSKNIPSRPGWREANKLVILSEPREVSGRIASAPVLSFEKLMTGPYPTVLGIFEVETHIGRLKLGQWLMIDRKKQTYPSVGHSGTFLVAAKDEVPLAGTASVVDQSSLELVAEEVLINLSQTIQFDNTKTLYGNKTVDDKVSLFMSQKDSIQTLIIGNSRVESGITAALFPSAYNFGIPASGLDCIEIILANYLPKAPNVTDVIIGIDPKIFEDRRIDSIATSWRACIESSYVERFRPTLNYDYERNGDLDLSRRRSDHAVFDEHLASEIHNYLSIENMTLESRKIRKFLRLVTDLTSKYRFWIVTSPTHRFVGSSKAVCGRLSRENYDELMITLQTHANSHANLYFRDFDHGGRNEFIDKDFFDIEHLTPRGAERFSAMIKSWQASN